MGRHSGPAQELQELSRWKKIKIVLFFPLVNVHLQMYEELKHASVT